MSTPATPATSDLDAMEKLLSEEPGRSLPVVLDTVAPEADAAAVGRSGLELSLLAQVLSNATRPTGGPALAGPKSARAGYLLYEDDGASRVYPLLAATLLRGDPVPEEGLALLSDLWRVDWKVASQLYSASPAAAVARSWLCSPGRRLLRDLTLLRVPLGEGPGATDWSWRRILEAAGLDGSAAACMHRFLPGWRQLHLAIPGTALLCWEPENPDPIAVLDLLEETIPLFVRAAALLWLQNRAMDNPLFPASGEELDLRDELKVPLISSLSPERVDADRAALRLSTFIKDPQALRWQHEHSHLLETSALLHAAALAAQRPLADPEDQRADRSPRAIWGVARWLLACLLHSPFLGLNETQLALRLRASLPRPLPLITDSDFLHPARFRDDGTGLDVAEVAFLNAVHAHHARPVGHAVMAPQAVLLTALRQIARRPLNEGERLAEEGLARARASSGGDGPQGALGWRAPHVAPPLLARYLLSARKDTWLAHLSSAALEQQWDLLRAAPSALLPWLAVAMATELHAHPALHPTALRCWRELVVPAAQRHFLAVFAIGILDHLLGAEERRALLAQAESAPAGERATVLELIARTAALRRMPALWEDAVQSLQALIEDESALERDRLGAALALVQRVDARDAPLSAEAREQRLAWIGQHLNRSPFVDHLGLRRALRSFGMLRG